MLNYDKIKQNLNVAARLVDQNECEAADHIIRGMVGSGLSVADMDNVLGADRIRKLRKWSQNK